MTSGARDESRMFWKWGARVQARMVHGCKLVEGGLVDAVGGLQRVFG